MKSRLRKYRNRLALRMSLPVFLCLRKRARKFVGEKSRNKYDINENEKGKKRMSFA